MAVLIKIIQLILALSILVIIHEFGHFLASRIFGVRVEKFYMFFDWKFSIFRCKKVNGKWRFKFFRKNEPEKYITHETTNPLTNKKSILTRKSTSTPCRKTTGVGQRTAPNSASDGCRSADIARLRA